MATRFGGAHAFLTQTLVRLAIVGVIFGVAAGIPDFGNVVSLIGGLANALMGLILPRAPPSRATSLSLSLSHLYIVAPVPPLLRFSKPRL